MHQKQPPAKVATERPAGGGSASLVASSAVARPPRPSAKARMARTRFMSGGLRRAELDGDAVHAVAQAGRPRPVLEDVAEMAAAAGAVHLGAAHEELIVLGRPDHTQHQ